MKQRPLLLPAEVEVGQRVCMRIQHAISPDAFTTYTDHEVTRLWSWASGSLRGMSLRPFHRDGPQVFVPIHHIVSTELIERATYDQRQRKQ